MCVSWSAAGAARRGLPDHVYPSELGQSGLSKPEADVEYRIRLLVEQGAPVIDLFLPSQPAVRRHAPAPPVREHILRSANTDRG